MYGRFGMRKKDGIGFLVEIDIHSTILPFCLTEETRWVVDARGLVALNFINN